MVSVTPGHWDGATLCFQLPHTKDVAEPALCTSMEDAAHVCFHVWLVPVAANAWAVANGVSLASYAYHMYVLPANNTCTWAGLAYIGEGSCCQESMGRYRLRGYGQGFRCMCSKV
jgi:Gametolysin peptidase M11